MKRDRPSQTASLVTLYRALADAGLTTVKGFRDPIAKQFLFDRWERFFQRVQAGEKPAFLRPAMVGANLLALRTLAIDAALMDALCGGIRQVVILGAGFDARAYRLAELAEARVFEVDHPATQALKRAKAHSLPPTAKELRFVSVDFEHESMGPALAAAGHRADEPTAWIWEGVVMYLSDAALYSTLREIAAASAAGSTLIVNYHTPSKSLASRLVGLLLRLWNEPQIGLRNPETIAAELHQAGFEVSNDSGIEDWARVYGGTPHHSIARRVRLAVARR